MCFVLFMTWVENDLPKEQMAKEKLRHEKNNLKTNNQFWMDCLSQDMTPKPNLKLFSQ